MLRLSEQALEEIIREKNDTLSKNEFQIFKCKTEQLERSIKSLYIKSILSISLDLIIIILMIMILNIS